MENIISNTKKITILERAKQIAQIIQIDNPDYYYLKELFNYETSTYLAGYS